MTSTTDSTPIEGSVHAETEMSSTSNSSSFSQSASSVENRATDLDLDEESDDSASSISTISTISSLDDDAEQEWQESLQQLELLVSLVLIPFFGKWVGRRCAYWAWTKFMTWKYPIEVVVTDKKAFSLSGVVGALSTPPAVVSPPL